MALVNWHLDDDNIVDGIPNYDQALTNKHITMIDVSGLHHRNINRLIRILQDDLRNNNITIDLFDSIRLQFYINSFIYQERLN